MRIPIEDHGWDYHENCPPDTEFIEYLQTFDSFRELYIFHLGPGLHHKLGLWSLERKNVFIRALSITPEEVNRFIEITTEQPLLNKSYLVDFGDIHLIDPGLYPKFDYITMFHLGEIYNNSPDYPSKPIREILMDFVCKLKSGGRIIFFSNSVSWNGIKPIVDSVFNSNLSAKYKSLIIYEFGDYYC